MSMWHPDPPQGFSSEQGQVIIGRPLIPLIGAPQGIGGTPSPDRPSLLAVFPPLGDIDYDNYKFYQINIGEIPTPSGDVILEITDSVGPGIFQEASGFDIRAFAGIGRDITQTRDVGNKFKPEFSPTPDANIFQLSQDELHLFAWARTQNLIHEWVLSSPGVFPPDGTTADFTLSVTENTGNDIWISPDGSLFMIVGIAEETIRLYSLPTPYSFATPPVLLDSFDLSFASPSVPACAFSDDGMQLYSNDLPADRAFQWNLDTPFTLPAPSTFPDRIFEYDPQVTLSQGNVRMAKNGETLYIISTTPDQISKYIITDGLNQIPIVNKAPDSSFDTTSIATDTRGITLSPDESKIWLTDRTLNQVSELFIPGISLTYEVVSINVTTGDFTIKITVPDAMDLSFIQLVFGNPSATDDSTALGAGTALSIFETPLLTKDEDNFLVDDQGRNIVAVQT